MVREFFFPKKRTSAELDKLKKEKLDDSKRAFVYGGAALGLAGLAGLYLKDKPVKVEEASEREIPEIGVSGRMEVADRNNPLNFLNVESNPKEYQMGRLTGRRFGGLMSDYTGIRGEVKRVEKIDFRKNVAEIWRKKLEKYKDEKGVYPERMLLAARKAVAEFDTVTSEKSNLVKKLFEVNAARNEVANDIDWDKVKKSPRFNPQTRPKTFELLQEVEKLTLSFSLLAYSTTEIMPTSGVNSPIGVHLYDFLLNNAGTNYMDLIPALGDNLISMGPYQFTDIAVKTVNEMQDRYLKNKSHVPQKIENLRGVQNHKAAFLFAFYNIMEAIKRLPNDNDARIVLEGLKASQRAQATRNPNEILNNKSITVRDIEHFIAAAHNLPSAAYRAFDKYLQHLIVSRRRRMRVTRDYLSFIKEISPDIGGEYAQKTEDNNKALREFFKPHMNVVG